VFTILRCRITIQSLQLSAAKLKSARHILESEQEVDASDLHSAEIEQVRAGIQKGAHLQLGAGIIDIFEYREILEVAELAHPADFAPLLFVIPVSPLSGMLELVPVKARASLLSEEYIIRNLPRCLFDVIEL
jgi:hypothetical protein